MVLLPVRVFVCRSERRGDPGKGGTRQGHLAQLKLLREGLFGPGKRRDGMHSDRPNTPTSACGVFDGFAARYG